MKELHERQDDDSFEEDSEKKIDFHALGQLSHL
jgi:hypothetical protein